MKRQVKTKVAAWPRVTAVVSTVVVVEFIVTLLMK